MEWLNSAAQEVGQKIEAAFITGDRWKLYLEGLGITMEVSFFAELYHPYPRGQRTLCT